MTVNLREYLKRGFIDAVGKMADYQIILNSAGWFEKNVLLEEDLAELKTLIDNKNSVIDECITEEDVINIDNFIQNEMLNT